MNLTSTFSEMEDRFESNDEKRYEWQMSVRANYLLLGDKNVNVPVTARSAPFSMIQSKILWPHRGELIAGSFMSNIAYGADIKNKDIDVYFKNEAEAVNFMNMNSISNHHIIAKGQVAVQVWCENQIFNLIHGIAYDDAKDLITHFDIRACSVAYDPQYNMVWNVDGSLYDAVQKRIVFNPVPHNTTIARVLKYAQRGFDMDPYQRLFFAELIRSDMYNTDLEISTGYRAIWKK